MLRQLTIEEILARWGELAPRLEKAIEHGHGDFDLEDVRRDLQNGQMQLWALESATGTLHSICTTQVVIYDRQRACSIVLAEGGIDSRWEPAIEVIGRWAKGNNCVRLEARGRRGWARTANAFGFKYLETTVYKAL